MAIRYLGTITILQLADAMDDNAAGDTLAFDIAPEQKSLFESSFTESKPALSLVPAKADQIAALYTKLTGKETSQETKKSLADTLRDKGWKVVNENGGGIVITGVQPPAPKPE